MPTRWKLVGGDHLELGAACHLFGDHTINWKKHANAAVLRQLQDASCIVNHLRLVEALANAATRGHKERIRNAAAENQQVNLLDQRFEYGDLARDLTAANNCREWSRRLLEQIGERLNLLLHQKSDIRRQVGGDTNGAGVGTVRCTERIVHEDIAI